MTMNGDICIQYFCVTIFKKKAHDPNADISSKSVSVIISAVSADNLLICIEVMLCGSK